MTKKRIINHNGIKVFPPCTIGLTFISFKFLGKIETYKKEWATEGDRMPIMKRKDNLKFEGNFEAPQEQKWAPGERAPIIK